MRSLSSPESVCVKSHKTKTPLVKYIDPIKTESPLAKKKKTLFRYKINNIQTQKLVIGLKHFLRVAQASYKFIFLQAIFLLGTTV